MFNDAAHAHLAAEEDRTAAVDMNVVMTHEGKFVEVQGTAERRPFEPDEHDQMLALVREHVEEVVSAQRAALGDRLTL